VTLPDDVKLVVLLCVPAVAFFVRVLFALLSEQWRLWRVYRTRSKNEGCFAEWEKRKHEGLTLIRGRAVDRRLARQLGKPLL
jgi:hypothetical protein